MAFALLSTSVARRHGRLHYFPRLFSPVTSARHYLHFEEIIRDGERARFGIRDSGRFDLSH
jgi:hypothetical protein